MTDLERQIRQAERAYDRALRSPRGDGLAAAGNRLKRLYAQQRRQTQLNVEDRRAA